MRVPANAGAEKLVLDYLGRLSESARILPKGDRLLFVGRTRSRIERRTGPPASADAEVVLAVLQELGDPEELVRQERARLDAARMRQPAGAASPPPGVPGEYRPVTARLRPGGTAQTGPRALARRGRSPFRRGRRAGSAGPAAPELAGDGMPGPDQPGVDGPGAVEGVVVLGPPAPPADAAPPADTAPPAPAAGFLIPEQAAPAFSPPGGTPVQQAGTGPQTSPLPLFPGTQPVPGQGDQGQGGPAGGSVPAVPSLAAVALEYRLETAAVLVLGLGGLFYPYPVWLIGSALAVASRFWAPRDKWLALLGPPAFALVAALAAALLVGGRGGFVEHYVHALSAGFGYLLMLGTVLSAGYLAWLVRHPRPPAVPPWRR